MQRNLTNNEKYKLLDMDIDFICKEIQTELFLRECYTLGEETSLTLQEAIGSSLELELDTEVPQENTRLSFYTFDNQIIIIKKKKFHIKRFLELIGNSLGFCSGNAFGIANAVLQIFIHDFLTVLEEDASLVYSYLCYEYFIKGNIFNNVEIFEKINTYLTETQGYRWPKEKLNKILLQLEGLKVMEFRDGLLYVSDKIYFN